MFWGYRIAGIAGFYKVNLNEKRETGLLPFPF
jgi:hypothetical protein